jgi:hypothetical protein
MNCVFLSTAIEESSLFGGYAGDSLGQILINFLDLYVVTHIILIHDMLLSSVTISVKGAFAKPHIRRGEE